MPKDKGQYVLLDARAMPARIALVAAVILALVFGWLPAERFLERWARLELSVQPTYCPAANVL